MECPEAVSPMIRGGYARGYGAGPGVMFLLHHPGLAEKVGLRKEEVSTLGTIAFKHRYEMIDLNAKAQRALLNLEKAKTAEKPDTGAVEQAIDEVHKIEAEIEKAAFRHQQEIRTIISEERLEDLREAAMKAMSEFRRERRDLREKRRKFQ